MTVPVRDRWAAVVLAIMYVVSLCLPALSERGGPGYMGGSSMTYWGYTCAGALPFVMIAPPWWANPLYLIGLVCLATGRHRGALILGVLATLLALGTIMMEYENLWPTTPGRDPFFPFGPGYFCWVAGMLGLIGVSTERCLRQGSRGESAENTVTTKIP